MERRSGRDQLHHRRRIFPRVRVQLKQGRAFCDVLDKYADAALGYPGLVKNRMHRLG